MVLRDQEDLTAADPDLVFTASKFVKNILEKAKIEAAKRLKAQNLVSQVFRFSPEKVTRFCKFASSFCKFNLTLILKDFQGSI